MKAFNTYTKISFFIFTIVCSTPVTAMLLTKLHDPPFKPHYYPGTRWQTAILVEAGFENKSFDGSDCAKNPLQIWNCDQNALKMLEGFCQNSCVGQLSSRINAEDDGVRGHVRFCGDLEERYSIQLGARYLFDYGFSFGAYLPFYSLRLCNVCLTDLTKNCNSSDQRVKMLLTENLRQVAGDFGCLDLFNWTRNGVGDLALLLEWTQDFPQKKPLLHNVRLNFRLGTTLPTGLKEDTNKLFALPFGNNGATSVFFGANLDFLLGNYMRAGLDVELSHTFGNKRCRRIKTDPCQTELLLLNETCAYKDFGLTQQFNLYLVFHNFCKGLSCTLDYQYFKHNEDSLVLNDQCFSTTIANNSCRLDEWTAHNVIVKVGYDFKYHLEKETRIWPKLDLYAKIPFNGKNITMFSTVGTILSWAW